MKRIVFGVLTAILIITITLVAMYILVDATISIAQITNPLARVIAVAAELILGVVLLLGTIFLATHLAVRIFAPHAAPPSA